MKTMTKMILAATVAISAISAATAANAAIVINITQVGGNVVATGSGSFNTIGLASSSNANYTVIINGGRGAVLVGAQTNTIRYDAGLNAGAAFGTLNSFFNANSSSGDTFGIYGTDPAIHLPVGYISGASLSGSSIYNNLTLASLGLVNGTYVYTSANDTVTVNIGPVAAAVPETATWGMMIAGFGMMGAALRTRRRSTKVTFA